MLTQLITDLNAAASAATALGTAITAVQNDLATLPAEPKDAKPGESNVDASQAKAKMAALIEAAGTHPILQALVCDSLPFLNAFLEAKGFPPLPTPAFCTTPTPTPAPSKKKGGE